MRLDCEFEPRGANPNWEDLGFLEGPHLRDLLEEAAKRFRPLLTENQGAHAGERCQCHGDVYATILGGAELRLTPTGWVLDAEVTDAAEDTP